MKKHRFQPLADAVAFQASGNPPPEAAGYFGADPDPKESAVVLIPVPWEATVSYGTGTRYGPEAVRQASHQLDLVDGYYGRSYAHGISSVELEIVQPSSKEMAAIEQAGLRLNEGLETLAKHWIDRGKIVGVIGGEHSVPYGLVQALSKSGDPFGILHIDAHHDLRKSYQGHKFSHASIMYNLLEDLPEVTQLTSVGIRDYSEEEADYATNERVKTFYWQQSSRAILEGASWSSICQAIIGTLPDRVYVSFDIDGLDPVNCPNTGTPVPGGLSFDQASFLMEELARSGKKIIGFDLSEVAPKGFDQKENPHPEDEWDANVGARILYKLCGASLFKK